MNQQPKKFFGSKENAKTLQNVNKLAINQVKKTQTMKSNTSRTQKNTFYENPSELISVAPTIYEKNPNHFRAKSALRYQNLIENNNYGNNDNSNRSFKKLDFYDIEEKNFGKSNINFTNDEFAEISDDFLRRHQKDHMYFKIKF